jgi:uncharacterized DUF497 family protein
MSLRFEWDADKAARNLTKHRVSFETAARAFADPFLLMQQDRFENGERRWQSIGMVDGHLVLLVAHTVGEDDDGTEVLRIISARKAESKERKRYEQDRELRS